MLKRREFTRLIATSAASVAAFPTLTMADNWLGHNPSEGLPLRLPSNLKKLVMNMAALDYKTLNTDWDGSILIEGLLRFSRRGFKSGYNFANNWFNYHVEHDSKLTDEEYYKQYLGGKARILREGPLTFVLYSANLGVAFPVHELYLQGKSQTARQVCMDVADAVLHYAARDKFGMLAHDDLNFNDFAIPDTAYWATRTNAIAGSLTKGKEADVYWKQSSFQLEAAIKHFFDPGTGLVRTGLFKGIPGKTYWSRSQGWLIWSISGLLRYLPKSDPRFEKFRQTMEEIAKATRKYQGKNGGLHVLVNDTSSPEEVTGIAMVIASMKEASRNGWFKDNYDDVMEKAWKYIQTCVDEKGDVHNAYTGWAVPAENGVVNRMDERFRGYVPGIIMLAADEMTR